MGQMYYAQSDPVATLTVGDLIDLLKAMPDLSAPVIFRSPHYGTFGSNQAYSVDRVEAVTLEGRVEHTPAGVWYDEEEDREVPTEAYDQVWTPWSGVVIS